MHTFERIFPAQQKEQEFPSQTDDGTVCVVKIRLVGEVHPTDHHYIQVRHCTLRLKTTRQLTHVPPTKKVYGIILRKTMEGLKLQEIRRNYYDYAASQSIPRFNLEVWPGYETSIRQHEREVLLCADVANKVRLLIVNTHQDRHLSLMA